MFIPIVSRSLTEKTPFFRATVAIYMFCSKWQICRKQEKFNELLCFLRRSTIYDFFLLLKMKLNFQQITKISNFTIFSSNGSGSREATTIKNGRSRGDTSGTGQENAPIPPTMNDKYVDLMALVLGHRNENSPVNYEKVIIKSDQPSDDSNPSLGSIMDVKLR